MFIHFSDSNCNYIYKASRINGIIRDGLTITIEFDNGNREIYSFDSENCAWDTYQHIRNQLRGKEV